MHRVFVEAMTNWTPTYPDQPGGYLATPTAEEAMALTVWEPIFQEASEDYFYKLITKEIDISEWDNVIQELKDQFFLDDIQAIYQARFDRYLAALNG